MQVEAFLEASARRFPDKVGLVCGEERLSYAEIEKQCNRLARALIATGVERGDRVVVSLPNSVDAALAIFAILKAGGVFVVVNPTTKPDKLEYILNNCRASALISWPERLVSLEEVWKSTHHLRIVIGAAVADDTVATIRAAGKGFYCLDDLRTAGGTDEPPAKRCIDLDLAALIYTSGSTGRPKGVMMTHQNIVAAATSITTYLENTSDDIIIDLLPLAFDYGLYQLLMAFKVGGRLILERSFNFPYVVIEKLQRERVTGLPIVPTISAILLQLDLSKYSFPDLRYITNTAAVLPTQHIKELRALFPKVKLFSMYGLTECKRVSYLPPEQIDVRPNSVGRGMPNEEVYIVGEDGRRLGPGQTGELVVRGANVMKGYWELPEQTAERLKPGPFPWEKVLYTGDLFRMDEEGYLYFVARKDDIIKTRGEKVSPAEVENAIYALPGVGEVVVVGVPDELLGSAITAYITLRPGASLTVQDVLRHCRERLEDFMVPKCVQFCTELPKTDTGKISRRLAASSS